MMKADKQIGFIYKNNESIDRILKDGEVVFERGFLREKTSTTLPITFGGVGKDLKDYIIYGNSVQNGQPTPDAPIDVVSCGNKYTRLPSEYQELDYIESNGTQYVDTGVTGSSKWEFTTQYTQPTNTSQIILGCGSSAAQWVGQNNSKYAIGVGSNFIFNIDSILKKTIIADFKSNQCEVTIDNTTLNRTGTLVNKNFYLFAISGNEPFYSTAKLYKCKCYQNNQLVRNLVPAVKKGNKNLFNKNDEYVIGQTTYNYTIKGLDPTKYYTCSTNFERISGVNTASVYFGGGSSGSNGVWSDTPRTFKPNSNGEIVVYIRHVQSSGAPRIIEDVMNGTIWVMVNEGETVLPYDEYSPEQVGMYDLNATSKNLFDGILEGGYYTDANFNLNTTYPDIYKSLKVYLQAGTYTISYTNNITIVRKLINGSYDTSQESGYNFTFTINADSYVGLSMRMTESTSTVWDDTTNIMLNEGSTALPYEPYQKRFYTNDGTGEFIKGNNKELYEIPVNVKGKNLLDDKSMTAKVRCTVDNGVITTSALSRASTVYVNINDIPLKAGEELYTTFKVRLKSGTASRLGYGGRLYDGTTYATNTNVTPSTVSDEFVIYSIKQTTTTDIIANQMVFQAENTANVSNAVYEIKDIIVSTNPIDTYEPYYNETTNIYLDEPLRKIDGYSDYIDFINGKAVRNIKEYILIGDEQIKMIREGMNCIKIDGKNIRTESLTMPPIFCNMLLANSRDSIYQGNVGIGYGAINNEYYNDIVMRVPNITTLTDFTTWLQSNNVIVDYVLETPTQEDIELPNIPTIDGSNTLNIETEITPSQVYIKYKSNT